MRRVIVTLLIVVAATVGGGCSWNVGNDEPPAPSEQAALSEPRNEKERTKVFCEPLARSSAASFLAVQNKDTTGVGEALIDRFLDAAPIGMKDEARILRDVLTMETLTPEQEQAIKSIDVWAEENCR